MLVIVLVALLCRVSFLYHLYSLGGEPISILGFTLTEPGLYREGLPAYFFSPDAQSYDTLAMHLLAGEGLWMEDYRGLNGDRGIPVRSFRPVMMPLYLAGVYRIAGHCYLAARCGLIVLSTASCILVYLLGRRLVGETGAWLAALGAAFYPKLVYYSTMLSTETLYIFFLLLSFVLLYRAADRMGWWNWVVAGVALALAILTRSVLAAFVPLTLVWLLVSLDSKWAALRNFVVLSLGVAGGMSPWVIRNYAVHGQLVPMTTEGGFTLWVTNNEDFDKTYAVKGGGSNYLPPEGSKARRLLEGAREVEIDKIFYRLAWDYIREHPGAFVRTAGRKFLDFWRPYPRPRAVGFWPALVAAAAFLPVLLLAAWAVVARRRHWRDLSLVYLLILYYTAVHMIFMSVTRYRMPLEPFMLILAGATLASILGHDE